MPVHLVEGSVFPFQRMGTPLLGFLAAHVHAASFLGAFFVMASALFFYCREGLLADVSSSQ